MTRIAIIADSHYDASPGGRFDECIRIHDWIAHDIERRDVDLVLHSGDVYERRSTPVERAAVAEWVRKVAELAPVVIVRGNHDTLGDLKLLERLRTHCPVIVEEGARAFEIAGVAVACLAWPRKAELLALGETDATIALRNVLRGMGALLAGHDGPRVLLAHAMVRGSRVSTGQPLVGCDFEIGLEDLALAGADLYALGHVHMPQAWEIGREDRTDWPCPVIYPGSPRRTAFGEVEAKGYIVADFEGRDLRWERVETPCTPMLLVEADWRPLEHREGAFDCGTLPKSADACKGAEIRFRYRVAADRREAAAAQAACWRDSWITDGAVSVKVEEVVIATSRARAPEIASARTVAEKLSALWKARGDRPDPPRAERLLTKLGALEHEVAA